MLFLNSINTKPRLLIRTLKFAKYFSEWEEIGGEEAGFLGAQPGGSRGSVNAEYWVWF